MTEEPEKSFFAQLKERKVIRVALVYIIVGWVVMQVGEVTFEALILRLLEKNAHNRPASASSVLRHARRSEAPR